MSRPSRSRRTVHIPVMLHEVLKEMEVQPGMTIVDGTVGAGGHSQKLLSLMQNQGQLIGLDRDQTMLDRAAQVVAGNNVHLQQASYAQLDEVLAQLNIDEVDRVLLDLGLSSDQLADAQRGFGYDTTGDLDMRFDTSQGEPVSELLQTASAHDLQQIFTDYGEEKTSAQIAQAIIKHRQSGAGINTVEQLTRLVNDMTGKSGKEKNPAVTRIFQALRIAVNRELDQLDAFLSTVLQKCLRIGGRALIITFHSLEDRMVKEAFRDSQVWKNLTRKPMVPTPSEIRMNPRSRSAKLRIAERIR